MAINLDHLPELIKTGELAGELREAEQTARKNYSQKGHYHGMVPIKLPNGRLLWRKADLLALLEGGKK